MFSEWDRSQDLNRRTDGFIVEEVVKDKKRPQPKKSNLRLIKTHIQK